MIKLYSFYWDCNRMGVLEGLFVAKEEDVINLHGKTVYFGEVLGKHSDITGTINEGDIKQLSDDRVFISQLQKATGNEDTICGFNPFDYYEPDEPEDDEEWDEEDEI